MNRTDQKILEEKRRKQELTRAYKSKSAYETSRQNKQNQYNVNVRKIARLKSVRTNLEVQKSVAKGKKTGIEKYIQNFQSVSEWTGEKSIKTQNAISRDVISSYENYRKRIDEVLDAVCDEITKLENENFRLNGDILHLVSLINSVVNEIRKLCN